MVRSKLPLFAALLVIGLTSTNGVPLDQTALKKGCDLASLSAGDECQLAWSDLKPVLHATQNMLGIAWVMYKVDKYMGSMKDAQKELDDKIVPVVKGPDDVLYCLDHHHLLAALDYAGAPLASAKPTIHVACDFSDSLSSDEFWSRMQPHMFAFGRRGQDDLPAAIRDPATAFPTRIEFNSTGTPFMDDTWRSLAGFTRKLDTAPGCGGGGAAGQNHNYGCRRYDKVCAASGAGVPFFEFRWGYLYNKAAISGGEALWPAASDLEAFMAAKAQLEYPASPGKIDSAPWFAAAATLFPLARGAAAGSFTVPAELTVIAGKLPGYKEGTDPFDSDDPDCTLPVCQNLL